jgi:hypothetical protein
MACKVGQTIIAKISGVPHEAKIRAVLDDTTEGTKLIVDFGFNQVATVSLRDIVKMED